MKKVSVYISMLFIGVAIFAGGTQGFSNELKYLTINEVTEMALNESLSVKQAELAQDKTSNTRSGAAMLRDIAYDKYQSYTGDESTRRQVYGNDYYGAEKNYRLADTSNALKIQDVEYKKKKAILTAKQKYLAVLKAKALVDVATNKLSVVQEQLKQTNLRYKLGMISKKDVLDAEVQLASAQVQAKVNNSSYKVQLYSLKREIGVPLFQEISLTTTFTYEPIQEINIEEAAELYVKDSYEYEQLNEMLLTYEELKKFGHDNNLDSTSTYDEIDTSIDETEAQIDSLKKDYALAIYGSYVKMKSSEEQINILQKQLASAKESVRIAKVQYKTGVTTALAVSSAETQLVDLQTQYFNAIFDYSLMKSKFQEKMFSDI